MKAIENWVKDIVFLHDLRDHGHESSADPKYEKYLRLFAGAVMILLAFGPLARIDGDDDSDSGRV